MSSTGFLPSKHGFAFGNCFECGTPVLKLGPLGIGDVSRGLCGGMIYLALDYFYQHRAVPRELTDDLLFQLRRRLIESFDIPFGYLRYYEGQWRPDRDRTFAGVRVVDGLPRRNRTVEWPKLKAGLDVGAPVPLGIVQVKTFDLNPWLLGFNHQVLAYAYDWNAPQEAVRIRVYDPNYPGDDEVSLTLNLNDRDSDDALMHSITGSRVRGFFITEYRKP